MMRLFFIICCVLVPWISSINIDPRILNGKVASRGQFPWQVGFISQQYYTNIYCGGAIISNEWILTTAECAYKSGNYSVLLYGSTSVKNMTVGGAAISEMFISHDNFTAAILKHNIALVKLRDRLTFNEYVQPVTLPSKEYEVGTKLTVSGWGQPDSVLMYTNLTTVSNDNCLEFYVYTLIYDGVFCAVNNLGKKIKGVCNGDEGDPLVVDAAGDPVLVGIHSLHSGCTRGEPSVHVNVFYYRDWIKEKTGI
jgi:secreted trypsin-like serine protease